MMYIVTGTFQLDKDNLKLTQDYMNTMTLLGRTRKFQA